MKVIGWLLFVLAFGNLSAHAEFDWKKAQGQYEENVRIAARYPFREFEKAAESGDLATVKCLLDQGVPADLPLPWPVAFFLGLKARVDAQVYDKEGHDSWNGWQALHFAASRDDMDEALEVAELLIRKGADVNAVTAQGETPLYLSKHAAMTRLLLQHGAKPDVICTGIIKRQPIHHFAMRGNLESIKLLLDRGVDIEARSADEDEQITALDTAAFFGKMDTVEFLLERGAKPTERTMKNARRFDTNPIEIVSLLHHHGGIVSAEMFLLFPKDCKSWQPVHFAAAFGDAAMLKAVIDAGGNPKAKTPGGKTPLQLAEEFNQEGSVRFLKTLK